MDINDFLNNGVTVKNPNYKKPTKRDPSGSPRFIQSGDYNAAVDRDSRIGGFLAENSYDLTGLNNDENKYADYDVRINPVNTKDELDQQRAKNQSAWEQTGRLVTQAVGNEIVLGTALGLSNLVDMGVNIGKEAGKDDYTNPFSTFLEGKQDEIRKAFEIYQENPNETFQVGDFGWWAGNAVSVASTLSMLIPSMAVTKGLGAAGKFAKLERLSTGIAKAASGVGLTKNTATLARAINSGAEIGTAALLSRTMEGYLEARGVYKETYDKSLGKLESMTVDEKAKLFKNNPQFVGMSNEEMASNMSSFSADETFKNDYAMLLFDIAQFKALGSMWKGVANKAVNSTLRTANRNAIAGLADDGAAAIGNMGFFAKRAEIIKHAIKNPMSSLTAIQLSEGLEEGYQGVQTEKGKEIAEKMLDPNFNARTLESYLKDGAIWEQAFWGVVGGMAFQSIGTGVGNLATAVKGKVNKRTMSEEDYALSQMTDEKIREQEIVGRQARMQDFTESMQLLNNGKNPFGYKIDPDTKQPILADGSKVNEDVSQEEAELLKTQLTNDFVTNMVLDATDKGNYDLFKEYVTDQNFDKFFQDAGLESNSGDKSFSRMLVDKMDQTYEEYNGALYDVMNSISVENESVAKIVARSIARRKLQVSDLYNSSDDLANQIATNADTTDYIDYEENQRVKYVKDRIAEIDKKEQGLQEMLTNKQISSQAVDQIIKENNIRRNQLLAFASTGNMFGNPDVISNILSSNINDANTGEFLAEFNKFLATIDQDVKPGTPKKSVQDIVKKKIEVDDHLDYIEKTLPTTQSNYQTEYDDVARNVDRLTVERYDKAVDIVGEYIESQPDLDTAHNNVMTNNVPANIKEQLDILKLGHHSTSKYTSQINSIFREVNNDRTAAAAEARNVNVDNTVTNDTTAENDILDIDGVVAETDNRESVTESSSTGEVIQSDVSKPAAVEEVVNPETFIAPFDIVEEVASLDKATESVINDQTNDFILDNDARAVGLASSITFNLFKTSRNLFDNLEGKDVNSSEFNNIVDIVADDLFTQGVSRGYTRQAAVDGIRMAMNMIHRRLSSKNISGADMFKVLADQLANKQRVEVDSEGKASTTTLIPDSEFNQVIDQFIDNYIQNRGVYTVKGFKTIINVEDLFRELLNNDGITYEQAKHVFFNIADYIRANNPKYIFINKTDLNKNLKTPSTFFNNLINNKSTVETVDSYMHIAAPSNKPEGYDKAVNEAINGEPVVISYFEGERGTSNNSISIKRNGIEIGYLGSVQPNPINTGYKLKRQNQGFVYDLVNNNGNIESNLDKLFIPLINRETTNYSYLMDIAYKQFAYESAIKNGSSSQDITSDEVRDIVHNAMIKSLVASGDIKIPADKITDKMKAKYILNQINNIIFYDNAAITTPLILESYAYWKSSTFNNYVNTHKIQQGLDTNKKINTKLVNVATGKVLLDNTNHNISDIGFTYEQNPIMIVDANGNIINEKANTSYSNVAGFEVGTMGMLITDNPSAPIIALFTESNNVSSNKELANRVYSELTDLLTGFQNREVSFDKLATSLGDMFSGPGIRSNNLFSGYSVIKTNDRIALNIQGRKGEYNLIVHKFEKGSNTEGTGITHIPNGDKSKANSSVTTSKSFNNAIAKEIVSNLTFNKTFYAINNKNVDNDKSNQYLYKEGGKLIIEIGGKKDSYNSFGQFVLTNNAFKTNQGKNKDGGFFDTTDAVKSLYINTAIITSPVEETPLTDRNRTASDVIKSATKTESVNTSEILSLAGVEEDKIAVLTGTNQFGIELIPKESYFDNRATKAEAYYSKGKMYFTNKGANNIRRSPNNLMRLLIHENLHAKFEEQGLFQQAGIVDDLMNTYNSFIEAVNNDTTSAEVKVIKNWIETNKFNPIDYISTLSVEQQRAWINRSDADKAAQFAEEWLVESLTQPSIIRYLNNTIYTGGDVSVEGIDNSAKTIWQRIIDVLLKLFGRNSGNIKNNTILAQQYAILGRQNDVNVATVTDTNYNTPGETPLENVTDVPLIGDTQVEDTTDLGFENESKRFDEQSDVDDLDFAVTSMIEDADEVRIATRDISPNPNMSGVQVVTDMNKYVNQFPVQDRPRISEMLTSAELKFSCQ